MTGSLRKWAHQLKTQVIALYLAYHDPRTPWYARVFAFAVVGYALSPIDLIPDMIPLLGYVDDLLLLPIGIYLAIRLIPPPVMTESRARAAEIDRQLPTSKAGATMVLALWILGMILLAAWVWQHFGV